MSIGRCFPWIALSCFAICPVYSQQATDSGTSTEPVFKSKVHIVVEDVVVTDRKGQPVSGLQKEDFQIFEAGKPQTVASFEEHKGLRHQAALPPLPPDIYTNYPANKPADSINVVLLDSLNTPLGDQLKVRLALASFLKSIPAGSHLALFTLSSGLHMVQGFTSDSSILLAALNKRAESRPKQSPLLSADPVDNLDSQINQQLSISGAGTPAGAVAAIDKLQEFQNQTQNVQDVLRRTMTLEALQQLSRFLTGVPGRKNVIWFSESFPLSIIPGRGVENYESNPTEERELRRTVNMLADAQAALYPISPEGLNEKFDSDGTRVKSVSSSSWRTVQGQDIADVTSPIWDTDQVLLNKGPRERSRQSAFQTTMDKLAEDTGGEAFYNTNGLEQAMMRAISDGAHYYTISYSPTDQQADGKYRQIEVKLAKGDYQLAYRHGYFAEDANDAKKEAKKNEPPPVRDPLRPLMISGVPDATQIIYKIRLQTLRPLPGSKTADTKAKKGTKEPLTRFAMDFAVLLADLTFVPAPDGKREARVEIALVAYDERGFPVNAIVKTDDITLTRQQYAAFAKTGVPLYEEIDAPSHNAYVRTGICDLATKNIGTLQVSLDQTVSPAVAAAN